MKTVSEGLGMLPVRRAPSTDCIVVAVAFGLAAGLAEVLLLETRRLAFGGFTFSGLQATWMTPAAYLMAFGLPALVAAVLAWRWPNPHWAGLVGAGCAGLTTVALLRVLTMQRLWLPAMVLMAAGIAVQTWRALLHPRVTARMRTAVPFLFSSALLLTGSVHGWIAWRGATSESTRSPRPGTPNVLLLILDTVRAASLSLYDHPRPTTPRLERWAERGVVFEAALAPSSWTLPSHASVFTGRDPHELGVDWLVPLDSHLPTLAEVLRDEGYRTGGFVANLAYTTRETGLARGFNVYRRASGHPQTDPDGVRARVSCCGIGKIAPRSFATNPRKPAEVVNREFLEWLGESRTSRPFFAFLNYFDAHTPYHAPDSLRGLFGAGKSQRDRYETAIAYLDAQIDALLLELERRGVLDETVVIITSDHGEQFGSHGLTRHGNSLYMQLVHVPLVIIHPRLVPRGIRVKEPVTLRNLAATTLDLVNVDYGGLIPGRSLATFWERKDSAQASAQPILLSLTPPVRTAEASRNAVGEVRSLVLGRLHYIRNPEGTEELFDVQADPQERRNLMKTGELIPELGALRRRMREFDSRLPRELRFLSKRLAHM